MITSILSVGISKSQRASITSNPLFIIVAESIVIFAPIFQVGCRKASAAVASRKSSFGVSLNAPPEAVRISFSTLFSFSPTRHWNIALCSESMGTMSTRFLRARSVTSSPATTSVSLFARAIFLPASIALTVGNSPEYPTIAVTTVSMGDIAAIWQILSAPAKTFMGSPSRASRSVL